MKRLLSIVSSLIIGVVACFGAGDTPIKNLKLDGNANMNNNEMTNGVLGRKVKLGMATNTPVDNYVLRIDGVGTGTTNYYWSYSGTAVPGDVFLAADNLFTGYNTFDGLYVGGAITSVWDSEFMGNNQFSGTSNTFYDTYGRSNVSDYATVFYQADINTGMVDVVGFRQQAAGRVAFSMAGAVPYFTLSGNTGCVSVMGWEGYFNGLNHINYISNSVGVFSYHDIKTIVRQDPGTGFEVDNAKGALILGSIDSFSAPIQTAFERVINRNTRGTIQLYNLDYDVANNQYNKIIGHNEVILVGRGSASHDRVIIVGASSNATSYIEGSMVAENGFYHGGLRLTNAVSWSLFPLTNDVLTSVANTYSVGTEALPLKQVHVGVYASNDYEVMPKKQIDDLFDGTNDYLRLDGSVAMTGARYLDLGSSGLNGVTNVKALYFYQSGGSHFRWQYGTDNIFIRVTNANVGSYIQITHRTNRIDIGTNINLQTYAYITNAPDAVQETDLVNFRQAKNASLLTNIQHMIPVANNTYDLGSDDFQWRHLKLSGGSIYMNGTNVLSISNGTMITPLQIVQIDTNNPGFTNEVAYLNTNNNFTYRPTLNGTNFMIAGDEAGGVAWGNVSGTISLQTDLWAYLNPLANQSNNWSAGYIYSLSTQDNVKIAFTNVVNFPNGLKIAGTLIDGTTGGLSIANISFDGDFIPTSSNAFDIGSSAKPVRTAYVHTLVVSTNTILFTDGTALSVSNGQIQIVYGTNPPVQSLTAGDSISLLVNDTGYITNYVETDPVFIGVSNLFATLAWVQAQGYLTNYTETDPVWVAISNDVISKANNGQAAFGWGNHATNNYLTPVITTNVTITGDTPELHINDIGDNDANLMFDYFGTNVVRVKSQVEQMNPSISAFEVHVDGLVAMALDHTNAYSKFYWPIKGSQATSCKLIPAGGNVPTLDWYNRVLYDENGSTVFAWNNFNLYDGSEEGGLGVRAINLNGRGLENAAGNQVVSWNTDLLLSDAGGVLSADLANRVLYYTDGTTPIIDWLNGIMNSSDGNQSLSFENYELNFQGGVRLSWSLNQMNDSLSFAALSWENRKLYATDGATTTFDWQNQILTNGIWKVEGNATAGKEIVNWLTMTQYVATVSGTPPATNTTTIVMTNQVSFPAGITIAGEAISGVTNITSAKTVIGMWMDALVTNRQEFQNGILVSWTTNGVER